MTNYIYPAYPILMVDDEDNFLLSVELTLNSNGITNIVSVNDSRKVIKFLNDNKVSLILLDINMPFISGNELLPELIELLPEIPIIIVSAINDIENAVNSIKNGAFNYILKPVDDARLITTIKAGLDLSDAKLQNSKLKEYLLNDKLEKPENFSEIITKSESMRSIFKYIEAISKTNLPVLITGETGTGKELIANAIHKSSGKTGNIVAINVAGVDDNLFSDTLFGHKKGAFTGAESDRKGMITQAENGTLFLDEIGDLSIESQVKLLRLLQQGQYYPLGSDVAKFSNCRIIVATLKDIDILKNSSSFRKDLYYRLQAHSIKIPPLRERKEDIPLLVNHFIEKAVLEFGKNKPFIPKELFIILSNYNFPGNVRELEGIIYDLISTSSTNTVSLKSLKEKLFDDNFDFNNSETSNYNSELVTFSPHAIPTIKEIENILIDEALIRTNGNQSIAAELLGISRRALNNRLQRRK